MKGDFNMRTLDTLKPGQAAVVAQLDGSRSFRVRLMELGIVPGTPVCCVGISPLGDPIRYNVRDAIVGLRRTDARTVRVKA